MSFKRTWFIRNLLLFYKFRMTVYIINAWKFLYFIISFFLLEKFQWLFTFFGKTTNCLKKRHQNESWRQFLDKKNEKVACGIVHQRKIGSFYFDRKRETVIRCTFISIAWVANFISICQWPGLKSTLGSFVSLSRHLRMTLRKHYSENTPIRKYYFTRHIKCIQRSLCGEIFISNNLRKAEKNKVRFYSSLQ